MSESSHLHTATQLLVIYNCIEEGNRFYNGIWTCLGQILVYPRIFCASWQKSTKCFLVSSWSFQHFCRDVRGFLNVTNARTQIFLPVLKPFKMGEGLGVYRRGPVWPLYFYPLCQNSPSLWVGLQLRGWLIPFSTSCFQLFERKHEQTASDLPCAAACVDGFICVTFKIVKWRWWKPHSAVKKRQKYLRDSAETHTHTHTQTEYFKLFTSACQM